MFGETKALMIYERKQNTNRLGKVIQQCIRKIRSI